MLNSMITSAEKRADHSLLSLASLLRALDDRDGIDKIFSRQISEGFGTAYLAMDAASRSTDGGASQKLGLREITNKVIHGAHYEWLMDDEITLRVHAHAADAKQKGRWVEAEIHLARLLPIVGQLD